MSGWLMISAMAGGFPLGWIDCGCMPSGKKFVVVEVGPKD